jgi:hypothetical protein
MEENMETTRKLNPEMETVAWGAFFILWGITSLATFLPAGTGAIGLGLIFLGLNAARLYRGLPVSNFTITLGILALVWGGLDLAGLFLRLPFALPVFPILLLVLGVIVIARPLAGNRN